MRQRFEHAVLVEQTRHLVEALLETRFGSDGHVAVALSDDSTGFGKRVVNGSLRLNGRAERGYRTLLGVFRASAAAARSDGCRARRPRLGGRDADRQRQVTLLPGTRPRRPGLALVVSPLISLMKDQGHAGRQRRRGGALQQLADE